MPDLPKDLIANEIIIYIFLFVIVVLGNLINNSIKRQIKQIEDFIKLVNKHETELALNKEEHGYIGEKIQAHGNILQNHEKRISKIEINKEKPNN